MKIIKKIYHVFLFQIVIGSKWILLLRGFTARISKVIVHTYSHGTLKLVAAATSSSENTMCSMQRNLDAELYVFTSFAYTSLLSFTYTSLLSLYLICALAFSPFLPPNHSKAPMTQRITCIKPHSRA